MSKEIPSEVIISAPIPITGAYVSYSVLLKLVPERAEAALIVGTNLESGTGDLPVFCRITGDKSNLAPGTDPGVPELLFLKPPVPPNAATTFPPGPKRVSPPAPPTEPNPAGPPDPGPPTAYG